MMATALRGSNPAPVLLAAVLATPAFAQLVSSEDEALRAQAYGRLVHTHLSVSIDDVEASFAFAAIGEAIGIPVLPRFRTDRIAFGLEPDARVSLLVRDMRADAVIELLLEQTARHVSSTWQIRKGLIEVSTKRRLSIPASRTRRMYGLSDFGIQPPLFASSAHAGYAIGGYLHHPYVKAGLSPPVRRPNFRKRPDEVYPELKKAIHALIEPGNWNYGQLGDAVAALNHAKIASVRLVDHRVLITAPPFVHRSIIAAPKTGPPSPLSAAQRDERLVRASRAGVEVKDITISTKALDDARLYGGLALTRVSLDLRDATAREAFDALAAALPVPLVVRYRDDWAGHGIDPDMRITMQVGDVDGRVAIERLLHACAPDSDHLTWQLRNGFIEAGTKARLAAPMARRMRVYHLRDLMFEAPDAFAARPLPEMLALDVVQETVETVEPGTWDHGQVDYSTSPERLQLVPSAPPGAAPRPASHVRPARRPRIDPEYVEPKRIAIIRSWRDALIVYAPDFYHRQINGCPPPLSP